MIDSSTNLAKYQPNIIDKESGFSASIPAILQMPPFWWEDRPEAYASVLATREKYGIEVDDWGGGEKPVRTVAPEPELPSWVLEETGTEK